MYVCHQVGNHIYFYHDYIETLEVRTIYDLDNSENKNESESMLVYLFII